jgi:hypothetical protein
VVRGHEYMKEILMSEGIFTELIDKAPFGGFCLLLIVILAFYNHHTTKVIKAVFDDSVKSLKETYKTAEEFLSKEIQELKNENRRLEDIVKERKGNRR